MADRIASGRLRGAALAVAASALLGAAVPARAQVSIFASNEVRAAAVKDRLREVKLTLEDGTDGARRLSVAITLAFKGEDDWAPVTEDFYARKRDLVARSAELERKLIAAIAQNSPERADDARKALEEIAAASDVLRSDFEFYMKLPQLANGPERRAALSAMRLLAQTGKYPLTLAYYLDKTPHRAPFAPMAPGATAVRPR
jgi:hypothetical protein